MRKKLLSIILAIAMLACMIPLGTMTAFAEEFPEELSSLRNTWWAGKAARLTPMNDRLPFDYDYTLHINEGGDMATLKVPGFNDLLSLSFSGYDESEGTITFSEDYTLTLKYESDEYGNVKPKWFYLTKEDMEGLSNDFDDYKMLPALPEELQNIVWEIYDYDGDKCMIDFGVSDVVVYYKNVITCATLTSLDKNAGYYAFGTPGESDSVEFYGMCNAVYGFGFTDAYGNNYYLGEHFDQYDCTWHEWYDNFFVTVGKPKDNAKVKICMDGWYDLEYGQPTEFPGVRLTSVIDGWGATYRLCGAICTKLSVTYETTDDDYYCFAENAETNFNLEEDNARAECPNVFRKVSVPTANPDLYYTGETQTGVNDGEGYKVTNGKAKEVGTYTATATINNGCVWYNENTGEIDWKTKQHTIDWEIISREKYNLINEICEYNGLMARQGKIIDGVVSDKVGRTVIPLTQEQLDSITDCIWVVGFDGYKDIKVKIDCAYTWFYNNGEKIEAGKTPGLENYVAFIIIDNDGTENIDNTITGFGYYRLYNGEIPEDGEDMMLDALYLDPKFAVIPKELRNTAWTARIDTEDGSSYDAILTIGINSATLSFNGNEYTIPVSYFSDPELWFEDGADSNFIITIDNNEVTDFQGCVDETIIVAVTNSIEKA